ncbi:CBASS cGAMP synthase [Aliamphritea spongicola]|nr:CBASS cGAMP synthase [Aliamphritea spongicola]
MPPQQIDLDDGVYFPMEVVEGNPKAAKDILFKLVDGILRNLANSKGWEFDDSKSTCARLNVNERIHIDVPIYAIPEERYAILKASLEARTFDEKFSANANFDAEEDIWLDSNLVYLAMRNKEHWKPSDPMVLQRWFEGRCSIHTKRLRRVCRYLKAWRDFTWKKGGPSSITLMVAATETFDRFFNLNGKGFDTDCQAFLAVVRAMPNQFDGEIYNPEDSEEKMFPRGQSSEELQIIRSQIRLLKQQTEDALCNSTTTEMVVDSLRSVFGMRIPNRPDWVEVVTVSESVRNIPAQRQERPQPSKSHRSA